MNRRSTLFLQVVIVLIGIVAAALLLWEPWVEGVNANATTLSEIYFDDPFLAFAYVGSISFFVALYQAFKVLGYVRNYKTFSQATVNALRTIQYCALTIIGFVAIGEVFILLNHGSDDPIGGVFMGILITIGSITMAATATMVEGIVQHAMDATPNNNVPA
jgi:hypothetical protein